MGKGSNAVDGYRVPRRRYIRLVAALVVSLLGALLWPDPRLGCSDPEESETSPDHAWSLTLCRRPTWFAMPGDSDGAPGWVVLRDANQSIRGIVDLGAVLSYRGGNGATTLWERDRVVVPLAVELPLSPASGPVRRWTEDLVWRLRARLGLVPTDDMFR